MKLKQELGKPYNLWLKCQECKFENIKGCYKGMLTSYPYCGIPK